MLLLLASIKKYLIIGALVIAALAGTAFLAFEKGVAYQKGVVAVQVIKADTKVVAKNDKLQDVADNSAKTQIIYKDRIITKYKTITKDITTYESNPVSSDLLDPDFISLHDRAAASNDQSTIAGSPGNADGVTSTTGVTKADAIKVITQNYKRYYLCKQQVDGWIDFYSTLRLSVNGKDKDAPASAPVAASE